MSFVYILQSQKNGRYYIGSTDDTERRLREHNSGETKSSKYLLPMVMLFKKEFADINEARRMEIKLKKAKSRKIIESIVRDQEIIMGL